VIPAWAWAVLVLLLAVVVSWSKGLLIALVDGLVAGALLSACMVLGVLIYVAGSGQ
jgi:hypothetical protein